MKDYLLLLCYCAINISFAQECDHKFFGEVHDFHDGSPIVNATIYIKNINKYATTDLNGKFIMENICPGEINIVVSHVGCKDKVFNVKIKGDTFKIINLEHHFEELHVVEVKGNNPNKVTQTAQETILKTKTIERYNSLSLGDALKQVSGVSSINTGNTIVKPMINGLHSSRIAIITNGVRLQDQEWGIEHAPNVDLSSVGDISVIKGSNALAHGGGAIGGVVVLNPSRVILKDSLYGKSIISGQSNGRGFSFSSTLTKTYTKGWYVNATASLKNLGDFETPDYNLTNTGLNSKGFSASTGYRTLEKGFNIFYNYLNNEIGILRASHIGNIEDLVNSINGSQPAVIEPFGRSINAPKQEITHQVFMVDFYKRFKKLGRWELQYDFQNNQRFEFDIRLGDDRDKPALDLNLKTHNISSSIKVDAFENVKYNFGLSGTYQNNFANPDTGIRRLIPDYDKYDFGIFAISNVKLGSSTNFDLGLRYDFTRIDAQKFYLKSRWEERNYDVIFPSLVIEDFGTQLLTNPVFDYHNISVSAGVSHDFNEKHAVIFNYGLSQRPPNPSELFSDGLHHSAARIELGDLRIGKETSNRVSATYKYKVNDVSLNLEGFYNHINNFIYISPTGTEQTIRGAFPVWNFQQTNARLFGLDLSANYYYNEQWSLINKSSIIKARDISAKQALIEIPSFKSVNSLKFSNKKWLDLNTELQSELVLRQNEYPNNNFEAFIPTTGDNVLVDISTPPPAYHLLHFQSDITLEVFNKTKLNISLNIKNVFNTSYRENLNRLRYFADDLGRNFMLQLKLNY
ncbi:TonB-dependent receptor [Flavivirga algicola]|uniref:TonB-dependent receptor n=1 Tax=Flavivirga algicola TaxID=2729136 RepID=A0ABX1S0M5_9FLAO|nr:TonB-dependent receptor [Flavivirga algicola]NMH89415.1 TonB-dependent receptor [Flavivirga algicola]